LADDSAGGGRDFDGSVGIGWDGTFLRLCILPVDYTKKIGDQTDGEEVVGVGEETDPSNDNCPDMIPAEWGLVDLSQGETTTFVGVSDVSLW
jgi:hypothetical protein